MTAIVFHLFDSDMLGKPMSLKTKEHFFICPLVASILLVSLGIVVVEGLSPPLTMAWGRVQPMQKDHSVCCHLATISHMTSKLFGTVF